MRTIFIALDQGSNELKYSNVKGKNPFKDKRVREALNLAVDREAIKRSIMRGLSVPAGIMVAPGVNGYNADLDKPLKPDLDKARRSCSPRPATRSGFEFQLNCPNNRYVNDEKICAALVSMWAKIGISVKLNAEGMATFIQKMQNFDTSAYMLGWGVATYDGQYSLQSLVRTRTTRRRRQLQLLQGQRRQGRPADRRDEDRDRRRQAQRDDPRRADPHARRVPVRAAAPPDPAVGDEAGRDHGAPLGRPARGALHLIEVPPPSGLRLPSGQHQRTGPDPRCRLCLPLRSGKQRSSPSARPAR